MSSLSFKIAPPPRPSSSSSSQRPGTSRASGSRSYHHSRGASDEDESSDEDGAFGRAKRVRDEAITGFDANGATSKHKEKKAAPLSIPSLGNKDWRAEAERRRGPKRREMYIPDAVGSMRVGGAVPGVGADGSQGGLGTRDTINDNVVVGGLALPDARPAAEDDREDVPMDEAPPPPAAPASSSAPETDEQRAYRELLSGGQPKAEEQAQHTIAPASANTFAGPADETSAFRTDVLTRPDEPDLDAYARVPVGQFGAALLRGMGWKEGTSASRTGRKGLTEAYVPKSRPAMLGIGAKPLAETLGGEERDRNGNVVKRNPRDNLRFVPLVKREREGSAASGRSTPRAELTNGSSQPPSRSGSHTPAPSSSRPRSRSPPSSSRHGSSRPSGHSDRDRNDRDRDHYRSSDRDRDRDGSSSHRARSHRERSRSPRRDDRDRERKEYSSRDERGSSRRDDERRDRDGGSRSERDYRDRDRDRDERRRRD